MKPQEVWTEPEPEVPVFERRSRVSRLRRTKPETDDATAVDDDSVSVFANTELDEEPVVERKARVSRKQARVADEDGIAVDERKSRASRKQTRVADGDAVDERKSRLSRVSGWYGRNRLVGFGMTGLVVAIAVVGVVALVGSNGGSSDTEATTPLSENPVVASYQQQLPALAAAVQASPNDAAAIRAYGVALYATGDVSRAKDQYEAELKVNQSDPVLLNNLGNVYRDLGSYDKALEVYQRSISLDSTTATAYMNLANLYQYTLNQKDLGIKTLTDALVNLPDNQDLGVLLGIAYEQNSDKDNAVKAFQQVLTENPDNAAAKAGIARLGG